MLGLACGPQARGLWTTRREPLLYITSHPVILQTSLHVIFVTCSGYRRQKLPMTKQKKSGKITIRCEICRLRLDDHKSTFKSQILKDHQSHDSRTTDDPKILDVLPSSKTACVVLLQWNIPPEAHQKRPYAAF